MDKKYCLTGETKQFFDRVLYRICALIDISSDIHAGDLGGWVESEENLSQEGTCWVGEEAMVIGNARISEYAMIYGYACINGEAKVRNIAHISGYAKIFGTADICGPVDIFGNTVIYAGCIQNRDDYICIGPIGSRKDHTTFFKADGAIMVACGCFRGGIDMFEKAVEFKYDSHESHYKTYKAAIVLAKAKLS